VGLTVAEKLFRKNGTRDDIKPGDTVFLNVDVVMIHEAGTCGSIEPLAEMGVDRIVDSLEVVCIIDHFIPAPTVGYAEMQKIVRGFVKKMGIKYWYEVGRGGVCHQVLPEKGHIRPGELVTGTDAHTTTYGALGAYPIGVCWTDMAVTFATGKIWATLPESVKIILKGGLCLGVASKDIILHLLQKFGESSLTYKSLEFEGSGLESLSVEERMTVCNMSSEMDIKAVIMKPDKKVFDYVKARTDKEFVPVWSDEDAVYSLVHELDLGSLEPLVACPNHPSNVKTVKEMTGTPVNQVFLGSCTNGRIEDLREAWNILEGHKIHPDVRMIVTPASQEIYLQALDEGLVRNFTTAGALVTNSTCGACIGGHMGLLADGEACAATSNRNYLGRMGSTKSEVYLLSPASAAAAAINGALADPRDYLYKGGG
jgi:3-isopropylmalate/(R)-2-methylmalate dehydratase large subunit